MTAAMNAPRGEVGGNSGSLVWRTEIARPQTPGRQLSGGGTQTQKRGWAAIGRPEAEQFLQVPLTKSSVRRHPSSRQERRGRRRAFSQGATPTKPPVRTATPS